MTEDVVLPKWGVTMQEATLVSWLKHVGDHVLQGDVLAVVETDKVEAEVSAPASGRVLRLLVAEGETIPVGTAMAVIDTSEASA